jgi:hypothetical protein
MKDTETRVLDAGLRAREFSNVHTARIPAGNDAHGLFAELNTVLPNLQASTAEQGSGSRGAMEGSTSKAAARDELMRDLQAIARGARSLAITRPGLEDKFRSPRSPNDQGLLGIARGFEAELGPFKDDLIKRGLPATFDEALNHHMNDFEEALSHKTQKTETRVRATAEIEEKVDDVLRILRELNPIMQNLFADDPGMLTAWISASHVERAPKRSDTQPEAPAPGQ